MTELNGEVDGLLDVIATEEPGGVPAEETNTGTPPKTEDETEEADSEVGDDTQDFSREPLTETEEEASTEPLKTETETETEQAPPAEDTWEPNLPQPPAFDLPDPEINEEGQIVNMDAQQYQQYIVEKAKHDIRQEIFQTNFESQALDAAEKILPELKTSPLVRSLVENARVAAVVNGQSLNTFEAAKQVREALGLTNDKLAQARAEATQNAKVSISVQKNAAVETGATKKATPSKAKNPAFERRLQQGDTDAFSELLDIWQEEGKL